MRKLLFAAAALTGLTMAINDSAAGPITVSASYTSNGGPAVGLTMTPSNIAAGSGTYSSSGADTNFSVQVNGLHEPILLNPSFNSNTVEATLSAATGFPLVLTVVVTHFDVDPSDKGFLQTTLNSNILTGTVTPGGITDVHVEAFIDATNTGLTTTSLASLSTNAVLGETGPVETPLTFTAPFSQTVIYTATFNNPNVSLNASAQIVGTIPEPATLALFGTALLGFGLARARRRQA